MPNRKDLILFIILISVKSVSIISKLQKLEYKSKMVVSVCGKFHISSMDNALYSTEYSLR